VKLKDTPSATYAFGYKNKPQSGNRINGLNERIKRRPRQVFHNTGRGGGREKLDYAALDTFFNLLARIEPFTEVIRSVWQRRLCAGPVANAQQPVTDLAEMSRLIKARAIESGAGIVGISELGEHALYEGRELPPYKFVISLGTPMQRDDMLHVPHNKAATEVMRVYRLGTRAAIRTAEHIRSLGWRAKVYADGEDILQIPMAIKGGLGQLGKHGSLISKEFGSNFRLAAVLTDLPLQCDVPVDLGVDDLCIGCRRCTIDCPPDAIFDSRQMVRGEKKWYVDFDKCVPYFSKTQGCGICIEVCPWSEPGRGIKLTDKLLSKRRKSA
jgi:Pyruvate/2-oxoacid:ferredoxin oxidoreductase delta subunit